MKPLYFRVKTGFEPNDIISIHESEYSKAIRAQIKKTVVVFGEHGSISGANIISVLPDWNKELGYHGDYQVTDEDKESIPRIRQAQYRDFTTYENVNIERQIQGLPPLERIENPNRTYTRGLTSLGDLLKKPEKKCAADGCEETVTEQGDFCQLHSKPDA